MSFVSRLCRLGEYRRFYYPRPANINQISLGETGGTIFMDTTSSHNTRSLTASSGPFTHIRPGQSVGAPWGYSIDGKEEEYQYQIQKVTRGISWSYEPYNKVSSYIKLTDYVGISGICAGVSGPTDRIYYRFHVGYTGAKSGTDLGFSINSVSGSNNKTWTVGLQPLHPNSHQIIDPVDLSN